MYKYIENTHEYVRTGGLVSVHHIVGLLSTTRVTAVIRIVEARDHVC